MRQILEHRLETLRKTVAESNLDGLIVNQSAYIYHLTDWLIPSWARVFLVIGPSEMILVTPFEPESPAPAWSAAIIYESFSIEEQIPATQNAAAALEQALKHAKLLGKSIGVSMNALPAAFALPLSQRSQLHDATDILFGVTAVKDEIAQEAIRERVGYLDRAFEAAQNAIRPGVSETQVFGAIYTSLAQSLGAPFTLDCNFGSGTHSLDEEPQPTNKLLEFGEVVMIDLFPVLGGYVADYTRNFVVGKPTEDQLAQHAVLEKALAAAEVALRPGIRASELDRLVRKVIDDEGFGEFAFQHHSGHAFGLTIPEPPWLIPADHTLLQAGMVIAVEPAIYHPQNGGMRLEGNYILTEDGNEPLVGFPARLTACE